MKIEEINPNSLSNNRLAYDYLLTPPGIKGVNVENTVNHRNANGYSDNSYSFVKMESESISETLKRVFSVDRFAHEPSIYDKRMLRLHSSELAAFLFFSNISETNPLRVPGISEVLFTKASFEASFNCVEGGPSRVDVLLNNSDNTIALFLEAKFSEYLHPASKTISHSYKLEYERIGINTILPKPLARIDLESVEPFKIQKDKKKSSIRYFYCEGVKQMLSHYIAVTNGVNSSYSTVYLGEVVFDFGEAGKCYLNDYSELYCELAINLNKTQSKVKLLGRVLTYQDILDYNKGSFKLPISVKQFYHL